LACLSVGLDTREREGALHVELSGELDISTAAAVESRLLELEDGNARERLILDLRGVSFLDSSGLSLLVNVDRRLRNDGRRLTVVSGTGAPHRILEVSGLASRIEIVEDFDS
jgi:anti-sigma B factor antagonist